MGYGYSDKRIVDLHGVGENGKKNAAKVSTSGRVAEITFAHMSVHEDGILIASDYTASVSTAGIRYLVVPPEGKELHCQWQIDANGPTQVDLREISSTAITDNGTLITQSRYNRNSTIGDTGMVSNYVSPTVTDDGSLLFESHTMGSVGKGNLSKIGGNIKPDEEWIVTHGKPFLIDITPDDAGTKVQYINSYYDVNAL